MSVDPYTSTTFSSRMRIAFRNVLRFILIIIIGAALGGAIYFGVPYLFQRFMLPVETNTAKLAEIESKQSLDATGLSNRLADVTRRLNELESRQWQSSVTLTEVQGQMKVVQTAIAANDAALKQLDIMQIQLQRLEVVSGIQEDLIVGKNSELAKLQFEVGLTRSIELLSRARLYLSQSNFGLARQDVQSARDLLVEMVNSSPDGDSSNLTEAITRLDLTLNNLPAFPVVAVDDLDIAWHLLVMNSPQDQAPTQTSPTSTPTVQPTNNSTPAP